MWYALHDKYGLKATKVIHNAVHPVVCGAFVTETLNALQESMDKPRRFSPEMESCDFYPGSRAAYRLSSRSIAGVIAVEANQ